LSETRDCFAAEEWEAENEIFTIGQHSAITGTKNSHSLLTDELARTDFGSARFGPSPPNPLSPEYRGDGEQEIK